MCKQIKIRTYSTKRDGQKSNKDRGLLSIIESGKDVPFKIKRVFYIYGSKSKERGGHRHKKTVQALICVSGEYTIFVDDGKQSQTVILNSPEQCLIVDTKDWHTLTAKNAVSVLLVLASEHYDANDYADEKQHK